MKSARSELLDLVNRFLSGEDQSIRLANEIEVLLVRDFPDSAAFEKLTEPLASYRPGGGPHYYEASELSAALSEALPDIKNLGM